MEKYWDRVEEITKTFPPLEERFQIIEDLNEECFQEYGQNLPNALLERLGTWYLHEIYSNKDCYKVQNEEFPILSAYQLKRRERKTVLIEEDTLAQVDFHIKNNSTIRADKKGDRFE